jgi:hypothetical protein
VAATAGQPDCTQKQQHQCGLTRKAIASAAGIYRSRPAIERATDAIDRIAKKEVDADQSSAFARDRKV